MPRSVLLPLFLALGLGAAAACGGDGITPPPPPPPPPLGVATIDVTGPTGLVTVGAALSLSAVAKNASGAPIAGVSFTWQSSAVAVATVSGQGLVQAVGAGTATITASAENRSGAFQVTVRDTTALPAVLSGKIERLDINIAEGQRHRVSGDLVLVADSTLLLAGTLELDPNASLTLYGGKLLRMTGIVAGDSATRLVLGGGRLEIVGEPPAQAAGGLHPGPIEEVKGTLFSKGPVYLSATFVVIGPGVTLVAGPGRRGTSDDRPGGTGEPLEIGTAAARTALGQGAGKPDPGPTASLLIDQSEVSGGSGGEGFWVISRDDGDGDGNVWRAVTGSGGKGGPLRIEATGVDLRGSLVKPGRGGIGGRVGSLSPEAVLLLNGSRIDKGGEHGDVTTGNGGDGGDLSIIASAVQNAQGLRKGVGAITGSVGLGGGNGTEGGPGGELVILVGRPGQPGQVVVPPGVVALDQPPLTGPPIVALTDALNGGGSIAPDQPGGSGGHLTIFPVGGVGEAVLWGLRFGNTANGGPGFDGCSAPQRQNGSNGGKGGERTLKVQIQTASLTEVGRNFSGGNGGPGVETGGLGGDRGIQHLGPGGSGPIGQPGLPGATCPEGTSTFTLVGANPADGIFTSSLVDSTWVTGTAVKPTGNGVLAITLLTGSPGGEVTGVASENIPSTVCCQGGLFTFTLKTDGSFVAGSPVRFGYPVFEIINVGDYAIFVNEGAGEIWSARIDNTPPEVVDKFPLPQVTQIGWVPNTSNFIAKAGNSLNSFTVGGNGLLTQSQQIDLGDQLPDLIYFRIFYDGNALAALTRPLIGPSTLAYQPLVGEHLSGVATTIQLPFQAFTLVIDEARSRVYAFGAFGRVAWVDVDRALATVTLGGEFQETVTRPDRNVLFVDLADGQDLIGGWGSGVQATVPATAVALMFYIDFKDNSRGRICALPINAAGGPDGSAICEQNSLRSRPDSDLKLVPAVPADLRGRGPSPRRPARTPQ